MQNTLTLLQSIFDGKRTFQRNDFASDAEFMLLVEEMRQLEALGFFKGYREGPVTTSEAKLEKVSVSHGLSDEGADYLIRIGGTSLNRLN